MCRRSPARFPAAQSPCYNLGALQPPDFGKPDSTRIRRAATLLPLAQLVVGLVGAGALSWPSGWPAALGFLTGAGIVALGHAAFGWRTSLRPVVVPAGRVFVRLLVGTLLKWLVIGSGLALTMATTGLPAGFVLAGALCALLAYPILMIWLLR